MVVGELAYEASMVKDIIITHIYEKTTLMQKIYVKDKL